MELPVGYIGCAATVHLVGGPLRTRNWIHRPSICFRACSHRRFGGSLTLAHLKTLPYDIYGDPPSNARG